jgi:peptidoglycan hydrolase-like protein with peptidoglycan-binding domain
MSTDGESRRPRRVRAATAGTVVVLLLAGGGVLVVHEGLLRPSGAAPAAAAVPTGTAVVLRTDVRAQQQVPGVLGFGAEVQVFGQLPGVLTALPAAGTVVRRGQRLYEVDGRPVLLLLGARPAWRPFALGMTDGPDVRQLEQNLVALGADPDRTLTVDEHFSATTAAAVRRWQQSLDVPVTGRLALGALWFWPQPLRVTGTPAQLGAPAGPGVPVLRATGTDRVVTVQLDPGQQALVRAGDPVQVTLPDGTAVAGRVSSVSRVASAGSAGQGGQGGQGGPGGGGQDGPGGQDQPSISALVRLTDPRRAGALDQAPVLVAITQQVRRRVLAVPVAALLARPGGTPLPGAGGTDMPDASGTDMPGAGGTDMPGAGGGYAVAVLDGGRREVPVRPGLYDELAGLVEVTGPGLAAGQTVEVPAT